MQIIEQYKLLGGRGVWNEGTLINISSKTPEKEAPLANILEFLSP